MSINVLLLSSYSNVGNNIQPKDAQKKDAKHFQVLWEDGGGDLFFTRDVICTQDMIKLIFLELAPLVLQEGEKCISEEELQKHTKERHQGDNKCECCMTGVSLIITQPSRVQTHTRMRAAWDVELFLDFCPTCCFRLWLKDKPRKPSEREFQLEIRMEKSFWQNPGWDENTHGPCLPQQSLAPSFLLNYIGTRVKNDYN